MSEVEEYIKKQKLVGFSNEHIKQELIHAGHQEEVVDNYFVSASQEDFALHQIGNIGGATFLGGPLAGIYLITQNYLQLGKNKEAKIFAVVSLSITFVLFGLLVAGLVSSISFIIFVGLWGVAEVLQGEDVKMHHQRGGRVFSIGKTALVALAALVCEIILFFALSFLYAQLLPQEKIDNSNSSTDSSKTLEIAHEEAVESGLSSVTGTSEGETKTWREFVSNELQLSFSYPYEYGDVIVEYDLGATPGSSFAHELCTTGGEFVGTVACTGAIISFQTIAHATDSLSSKQGARQFMYVHGEYMSIPPKGGWWGALDINQQPELEPWLKNNELLGVPNTNLYRTEMGGDMLVQFAASDSPQISHVVIASPVQFGAYTPDTFSEFQTHLIQIPPPPQYENTEAWNEAFSNYVQEVEMYDISDDPDLQKYIKVLETISVSVKG